MRRGVMAGLWGLLLGAAACNQLAGIDEGLPLIEGGSATGSGGGAGSGGGGPAPECAAVEDCEASASECRKAVGCEQGACVFEDALDGTPLAAQTPGDCMEIVCDGKGGSKVVPVGADAFDDGKACTLDACNDATPVHTPLTEISCYTGPAGTNGMGICAGGVQKCDAQANPIGACEGQVLPKAEACEAAHLDEDCDGQVNEDGAGCVCGDGDLSAGEECDDGGAVGGDSCAATCKTEWALPVAGGFYTCALLYNGAVKCWGNNVLGQLGQGDTDTLGDGPNEMGQNLTPVSLGSGKIATAITAGEYYTCARFSDGSVKCWGSNTNGQLGQGDTSSRGDAPGEMGDNLPVVSLGLGRTATAISAGHAHMCVLLDDGSVKCWGDNFNGQLGQGDTSGRGDAPGEMGDNLPVVSLGLGRTATAISAGGLHTCALLDDGSIKCWGYNDSGQLGLGNSLNRGDAPGEMGDNLPGVSLGSGKIAMVITAGVFHTCALLDDGNVKCWGNNEYGQLGQGDTEDRGGKSNQMGDNLPAVSLGVGKKAIRISASAYHTCALLDDGSVKCWGYNKQGELGQGDLLLRGDAPGEMGDNLAAINLGVGTTATAIAAGLYNVCAQLQNGSIKCWGYNNSGQLGLGDSLSRGDEPNEMGDNLPTVKLFSAIW